MASINEFISQVKSEGLARDNRFLVEITPPQALFNNGVARKLSLYCQNVSLPGLNFASNPVTTYGEQREVIYNRQFEPLNMEFLGDNPMRIKKFFDQWQQLIIDPVTRLVSYYQDYIGTVEISQIDVSDEERATYKVRLFEAFPKTVSPMNYTASSKDVSKVQVSFEYKYWTPVETGTDSGAVDVVTDNYLYNGAPALQNLDNMRSLVNRTGGSIDFPYMELDF